MQRLGAGWPKLPRLEVGLLDIRPRFTEVRHRLREPVHRPVGLLVAAAHLDPSLTPPARVVEILHAAVGLGEEKDRPRILGVEFDLGQQPIALLRGLVLEQVVGEQLAVAELIICAAVFVFEAHIDARVVLRSGLVSDTLEAFRERALQDGGLVASGESLVAAFGELASCALVADELHTAVDQFVVVRERDARLQFALQCRIGAMLGHHRPPIGEQIRNTRDFEDFRFPVVDVEDDLRACDPGIAARAVGAR